MTIRTTLLAFCMVSVPAVALFSHRLPAGFRAGMRTAAAAGVAWCRDAAFPGSTPSRDIDHTPPPPAVASGTDRVDEPVTGAAVPPADPAADPSGLLADLGAKAIECRPLPGPQGGHVASCAMPLDSAGQLLRVFHAVGVDREEAFAALHAEVAAWRMRADVPVRQAASPAASSLH